MMIEIWAGLHGEPPSAVGGSLDHIFLRVPDSSVVTAELILMPGKEGLSPEVARVFDGTAGEDLPRLEQVLRDWKVECAREGVPEFASDHQMLYAECPTAFASCPPDADVFLEVDDPLLFLHRAFLRFSGEGQ